MPRARRRRCSDFNWSMPPWETTTMPAGTPPVVLEFELQAMLEV